MTLDKAKVRGAARAGARAAIDTDRARRAAAVADVEHPDHTAEVATWIDARLYLEIEDAIASGRTAVSLVFNVQSLRGQQVYCEVPREVIAAAIGRIAGLRVTDIAGVPLIIEWPESPREVQDSTGLER